jgi:hypothetical protein
MSTVRTWEVYRSGWDHPERVKAVSGERACDMVSRSCSIPRHELIAHPSEPREGDDVMSQINVVHFGHAEIRRDEMYCFGDFIKRTGISLAILNRSRDDGLVVLCFQGRAFIRGGDWIDWYIRKAVATPDPIPDGGPTPADLRGEVEHGG